MDIFLNFLEKIKLYHRAERYRNRHDKGGINFLVSSIRKGQTAMDIGAHKAGYTYWMINQVKNTGMVYAFEPQLHLYNYISRIKDLYKWDNLKIENLALSDEIKTTILNIPHKPGKKSSTGATIVENEVSRSTGSTEKVKTETLDSYCNRNKIKPDFLKIDVEGNELRILRGGTNTLINCKPKILVEIEARCAGIERVFETFEFLGSLGYSGHFIQGSKRIPLALFSLDKNQNLKNMKNYCNNFTFE